MKDSRKQAFTCIMHTVVTGPLVPFARFTMNARPSPKGLVPRFKCSSAQAAQTQNVLELSGVLPMVFDTVLMRSTETAPRSEYNFVATTNGKNGLSADAPNA